MNRIVYLQIEDEAGVGVGLVVADPKFFDHPAAVYLDGIFDGKLFQKLVVDVVGFGADQAVAFGVQPGEDASVGVFGRGGVARLDDVTGAAFAHSGGTDSSGTGTYHYN